MDVIPLTRKLISIPSHVGNGHDERAMAEFVFEYLKNIPFLKVEKQDVENGRFNIIARTSGKPKLLLAGHLDTVEPKTGWTHDQYAGAIKNGKLFGLGSADMKGGIAAILTAVASFKNISGLTLLFYCDEEYDFKGMRKFISSAKLACELAIVAESSGLKIWNAHRGLIEISFSVRGKTGHAARPKEGKNAIKGAALAIFETENELKKFGNRLLGDPSINIAFLRGGLNLNRTAGQEIILGKEGNNIADYAEAVLDIRTTSPKLKAATVIQILRKNLRKLGLDLTETKIRHDLGALWTDPKSIKPVMTAIKGLAPKTIFLDPSTRGYGDGQMIQEKFGIPVINLGPEGGNEHGADEWSRVSSLEKLSQMFVKLIYQYLQAK